MDDAREPSQPMVRTESILVLALPRGRILDEVRPLLRRVNIEPEAAFDDDDARQLEFATNRDDVRIIRVRSFDVATFVAFGAAQLALLDGTIEVVAFGSAYEENQELWKEGNLLRVIGKVRVYEGNLSINCEEVLAYEPPVASTSDNETETPAFVETITVSTQPVDQTVASASDTVYSNSNGNSDSTGSPNGAHWLQLMLQETEDPQKDEYRLREAMKLLLEFPGRDAVLLEVQTNGRAVRLEASITANSCPELYAKLEELLGTGAVQEHSLPAR